MQHEGGVADAAADTIHEVGDRVRLINLVARPELNGCLGQIAGPLEPESGRYPVKLSDGGGLKVKPQNLRKGTPAAAGGPVPLQIDEEERKRIPLPRNVKKLLAFVSDPTTSDGAKLECFKSLQGHAESQKPDHHQELLKLGIHTTIVRVLDDAGMSDVVKGAAGGVLQNLALLDSNHEPIIEADAIEALGRRLKRGVHPLGREGAADCLLNLASTALGKQAIGQCTAALAGLVKLASEMPVDPKSKGPKGHPRPSAQSTAMAVLGCCLQEANNWLPIVTAGGLRAAVCMLRRADTTKLGRERAVGLCNILAFALPDEHRQCFRESECIVALHEVATSTEGGGDYVFSAKAQETARECMSIFAQRGELTTGTQSALQGEVVEDVDVS